MKNLLVYLIFFLTTSNCLSQSVEWQQEYGGLLLESIQDMIQAKNGDYLFVGSTNSKEFTLNNAGQDDAWVIRTDDKGNLIWEKSFGGSDLDEIKAIKEIDTGFVLAGITASADMDVSNPLGEIDYWLLKITHEGDLEWEKTLGGAFNDFCSEIVIASDGSYLIGGHSEQEDAAQGDTFGNIDKVIFKVSPSGEVIWKKNYDRSNFDRLEKILPTNDGGFLLGGSISTDNEHYNFNLIKTNSSGEVEWENNYGGSTYDVLEDLKATSNGEYYVGGTSRSSDGDALSEGFGRDDYWLLKVDRLGDIIWEKKYGFKHDDLLKSLIATSDGGAILSGSSSGETTFQGFDYWVIKIDKDGKSQWSKNYGLPDTDFFEKAIATNDGGILLGGTGFISQNNFVANRDFLVFKIKCDVPDDCQELASVNAIKSPIDYSNISLFPNPTNGKATLNLEEMDAQIIQLSLFDLHAQLLVNYDFSKNGGQSKFDLDMSPYPNGTYFVKVLTTNETFVLKLLLQQ